MKFAGCSATPAAGKWLWNYLTRLWGRCTAVDVPDRPGAVRRPHRKRSLIVQVFFIAAENRIARRTGQIMKMRLRTWDRSTLCIVEEISFDTTETVLNALIGEAADESSSLELNVVETKELSTRLNISLFKDFDYATVDPEHFVDSFPYEVHTNRELTLMLSGTKPLAVFAEPYPDDVSFFAEDAFDSFVKQGRFVKREYVELGWRSDPRRLR